MTDLPRLTEIPVPKFKVGQKVWKSDTVAEQFFHPCPDCKGTRKWKAISPVGTELPITCPRCARYNSVPRGIPSLAYWKRVPRVRELTIGQVQIDTNPRSGDYVTYMCLETGIGSGNVWYESKLFATREEAGAASEAECAVLNAEIVQQPHVVESLEFVGLNFEEATNLIHRKEVDQLKTLQFRLIMKLEDLTGKSEEEILKEIRS